MQFLIIGMIVAGSLLMVYNIIRYAQFIKRCKDLEKDTVKSGVLLIPLLLLIFFLIGYIGVGVSGIANILIASILFGGSVFVFLLLLVMFLIVERIVDTEQVLAAQYDEVRLEISEMTKDAMAVFRVNLTKDEIEERGGKYLYDSDHETDKYSELLSSRGSRVIDPLYKGSKRELFKREGLLKQYQEGQTSVSEIVLVRRKDGVPTFVNFEATLTKKPVSGDVIAFIVERPYNEEVVRSTLLERVLMDQYDRIAYIVEGQYKVVISNAGKKEGMLLNDDEDDSYESIYLNVFLPMMAKEARPKPGEPNPLRLSVIENELKTKDVYEVNIPFVIEGETRNKRFLFYRINENARFYLMLLSDSSKLFEKKDAASPEQEAHPGPAFPEPAPEETPREEVKTEEQTPALAPLRLLVVDDNEINREIAELLLTSEGHEVDLACDGGEAVEKVKNADAGRYDAVLMDVQMPVLNGYEATFAIRALDDKAKAGIPVVAMTANAFAEDKAQADKAGMNGYVTKPISYDEIVSVLGKLLGQA